MVHEFLRSIGFRSILDNDSLYRVLNDVIQSPDSEICANDINDDRVGCRIRYAGEDFGIAVCGSYPNDQFHMEYYFPFYTSGSVSTYEQIELEHYSGKEGFAGICDELRLGVTLIFAVQNPIQMLRERMAHGNSFLASNAALSGLAVNGKILFPVQKTGEQKREQKRSALQRQTLMQKAREGNQTAIDSLTMQEMDLYSMITRRAETEDVFSIVESSFIPYGVESEQYVVLGEIVHFMPRVNKYTQEMIWVMTLDCNDLIFDVCINQGDLLGVPEIGRRFRGRILMQGAINFM